MSASGGQAVAQAEAREEFACFGSRCGAIVQGAGPAGSAEQAVALVRRKLLGWHGRFSRFLPDSELMRLNRDPRRMVPVSGLMARLADAVVLADRLTGGLVDGTLVQQLERAGYVRDVREPLPLSLALELAPPRRPATAAAAGAWQRISVEEARSTVTRPPGVQLDSGGLAKGLFADVLAEMLAGHRSFAIDCAGDLAIGGAAREPRALEVASPFDGRVLHTFRVANTGVATSGISRRSWLDSDGQPAHHLLDPASGRPAFTGIVQVTALAPSVLMAEIAAKAALLGGPRRAPGWLAQGGVIVYEDGSHRVIEPPSQLSAAELLDGRCRRPT